MHTILLQVDMPLLRLQYCQLACALHQTCEPQLQPSSSIHLVQHSLPLRSHLHEVQLSDKAPAQLPVASARVSKENEVVSVLSLPKRFMGIAANCAWAPPCSERNRLERLCTDLRQDQQRSSFCFADTWKKRTL
jgi:hypothetical protein